MMVSKFSLFFRPRPPDTTFVALPRSGRSDTVSSSETHSDWSSPAVPLPSSTETSLLPSLAASKEAVRTVNTLMLSLLRTVAVALPA